MILLSHAHSLHLPSLKRRQDLIPAFKAVLRLTRRVQEWRLTRPDGVDVPVEPEPAWRADLETLQQSLIEIISVPSSLGSGHRGLVHKCSNVAFSWFLEAAPGEDLNLFAHEYRSHTSELDRGYHAFERIQKLPSLGCSVRTYVHQEMFPKVLCKHTL